MKRKASKPGVSRLNSDPGNPVVIPVEGEAEQLEDTLNILIIQNVETDVSSFFIYYFTEFPAPKNELFQHFHVYYLGCEAVAKPVGEKTL